MNNILILRMLHIPFAWRFIKMEEVSFSRKSKSYQNRHAKMIKVQVKRVAFLFRFGIISGHWTLMIFCVRFRLVVTYFLCYFSYTALRLHQEVKNNIFETTFWGLEAYKVKKVRLSFFSVLYLKGQDDSTKLQRCIYAPATAKS
jgi:hypothetical protein